MRLVTTRGRAFLAATAFLYAAGVALGYRELIILASAALLVLVLGVASVLRRPPLEVDRRVQPDRVTVGSPAHALITVKNLSRRASAPFVATDRVGDRLEEVAVPAVVSRASVHVPYEVPTLRRGRIRLGPVTVTRSDAFGLLRHEQPHPTQRTLWVRPRTHRLRPFPTGVTLDLEGPLAQAAPRGAITFSSLREYVLGDDVRKIHWPSTARTGNLMVRDHVDTSQPRTTVAIDVRSEMWSAEAFEHGVEAAASLAAAAERDGHPVTLLVGDPHAGNGAGPDDGDQPTHILDRLCLVEIAAGGGERLFDVLETADAGGVLVVVTGRRDAATTARLARLLRRFSLVVTVHMQTGADPHLDRRTGLVAADASTGRQFAELWNRLVGR